MYMLQEMLQTGQYQVEDLVMKYSYLLGEVRGQYTGADHARHLMQLSLAANRLMGANFSNETARKLVGAEGAQGERPPRNAQPRRSERSEERERRCERE